MEIQIKSFAELTPVELYGILRLRGEVFVVEQQCAYQDVDNLDQRAFHLMLIEGGELLGYARIFRPGELFENAAIGRVVVAPAHRGKAYGIKLMEASMAWIGEGFPKAQIEISAQAHLISFYSSLGFQEVGEEYLEDGIPHVRMLVGEKK
ncbi:MAG TPA: GNAT family N-acetyltransferase [Flavobacteriaceae bacterium]|nr:GNAT family N-acetyltransferase [Flavobacteriaceae bacterium]